jgi:transposase-like protein
MLASLSPGGTALLGKVLRLPTAEQSALLHALEGVLASRSPVLGDLSGIRQAKFADGLVCPYCGNSAVVRNGSYRGRQRYMCRAEACGRTFNDFTGTPFHGAHHPEKWEKFLDFVLEGLSLRKIAKALNINLSTAFFWRHKFLRALNAAAQTELAGIVESDETYVLESRKGQKGFKDRLPRHRGGVATRRGISREQVCIFVATDRHGKVVSTVAGFGRLTTKDIKELLEPHAERISALCSDEEAQFKGAAARLSLPHHRLNSKRGGRVKYGVYHIQNVNAYHSRLKDWSRRFNGVSTRWLGHYLGWHRVLDALRRSGDSQSRKRLLLVVCTVTRNTPVQLLRPDKKTPGKPLR